MNKIQELDRLNSGDLDPPIDSWAATVFVQCDGNAAEVLTRTKEVLECVIDNELDQSDSEEFWNATLPAWFVSASRVESRVNSDHGIENGLSYDLDKGAPWKVGEFVEWFKPEMRTWFWWGSEVVTEENFEICLAVTEAAIAWGSLRWLLVAAGAKGFSIEDPLVG